MHAYSFLFRFSFNSRQTLAVAKWGHLILTVFITNLMGKLPSGKINIRKETKPPWELQGAKGRYSELKEATGS